MKDRQTILKQAALLFESWNPALPPSDERVLRALHWEGGGARPLEHILHRLERVSHPYAQLLTLRLAQHSDQTPLPKLPRQLSVLLRLTLNRWVDHELRRRAAYLLRLHGGRQEALALLQQAEDIARREGRSGWIEVCFLCRHLPDIKERRVLERLARLVERQRSSDGDIIRRLAEMPSPVVVRLLEQLAAHPGLNFRLRATAIHLLGERPEASVALALLRLRRCCQKPELRWALMEGFLKRGLSLAGYFNQQEIDLFLREHCPEHLLERIPAHLHHRLIRAVLDKPNPDSYHFENDARRLWKARMTAFRKAWLLMQLPRSWHYARRIEPVRWQVFERWLLEQIQSTPKYLTEPYTDVIAPAVSPALINALLPRAIDAIRRQREDLVVELMLKAPGEAANQARRHLLKNAGSNDLKQRVLCAIARHEGANALQLLAEMAHKGFRFEAHSALEVILDVLPEADRLKLLDHPPFQLSASLQIKQLKKCTPSAERNALLEKAAAQVRVYRDLEALVAAYHEEVRTWLVDLSPPFLRLSNREERHIFQRQLELFDEASCARLSAALHRFGFEVPEGEACLSRKALAHQIEDLWEETRKALNRDSAADNCLLVVELSRFYPTLHVRGHALPGCYPSMLLEEPSLLVLATGFFHELEYSDRYAARSLQIAQLIAALPSAFDLAHFIEQHNEALRRQSAHLVLYEANEGTLHRIELDWRLPSGEVIYSRGRLVDAPVLVYVFGNRRVEQPATGDVLLGTLSYLLREHPEEAVRLRATLQGYLQRGLPPAPGRAQIERTAARLADLLTCALPQPAAPRSMGCGFPIAFTEKPNRDQLFEQLRRHLWLARDQMNATLLEDYVRFAMRLLEKDRTVSLHH